MEGKIKVSSMPFEADSHGECDECHQDNVPLITYDDEPGEWQFCSTCHYRQLRRAKRILHKANQQR